MLRREQLPLEVVCVALGHGQEPPRLARVDLGRLPHRLPPSEPLGALRVCGEGRELKGLKITGSSGFGGDKGIAVYNCGIDFTLSLLR